MGEKRKGFQKQNSELVRAGSRERSQSEFVRSSALSNVPHVEMVRLATLKPHPNNPRVHPKQQIRALARSLREYGFLRPILIDADVTIIAGHALVLAAEQLGYDEVPAIRIGHLTEAQIRAYTIADNKLPEGAGWDRERLAIEFDFLADANFDLEQTGFETPEIDLIMGVARDREFDDLADDSVELTDDTPAVSRHGDIWIMGKHRLICGDALDLANYEPLVRGEAAGMVCSDLPYNLQIDGVVSGLGSASHREFAMASGEMSSEQFIVFLTDVFRNAVAASRDGSIHFAFMDWRHSLEILAAGNAVYSELKNICVWVKSNAGMGSLFRSQHEFVFVFKNGTTPHINNVELGKHGRHRSNVWQCPGVNAFSKSRSAKLETHPTVKPVAIIADVILDCSRQGDIILDPFAGSGTIFIAAEKTRRRGYGIEIDPVYVDSSIRRWQKLTGKTARHLEFGLTFDDLAARRRRTDADA